MRKDHRLWRIIRVQLKEIQKIIKKYYKHLILIITIIIIISLYYMTQQKRFENVEYKKWYKSWYQIRQKLDNKTN